jgi:hypothetical protein
LIMSIKPFILKKAINSLSNSFKNGMDVKFY